MVKNWGTAYVTEIKKVPTGDIAAHIKKVQ